MIQIKAQGELPSGEEDESRSELPVFNSKGMHAIVFPCRIGGWVRNDKNAVMFTRRNGGCGSDSFPLAPSLKQGGELLRFLGP